MTEAKQEVKSATKPEVKPATKPAVKPQVKASAESTEKTTHSGIYCHGTDQVALFTILLPDNTCGMFMMPSARDVFWMGFTTYKVEGDKLFFKIQNEDPGDPSRAPLPDAARPTGKEKFINATLVAGQKYLQHGDEFDTRFLFLTDDTTYWQKLGWKKLGEARHLEGMEDFDSSHEIRKLCAMIINKFGPIFIWA
jgi:hypothetical protein